MPVCPRCDVAFIDGESHTCRPKDILRTPEEKVFRLLLWLGFALLVLYVGGKLLERGMMILGAL